MLPSDLARLAASYARDAVRHRAGPRSAEVRGRVGRVAKALAGAADAVSDLQRDDRELLGLSQAATHQLVDHLYQLSKRADDVDTDLKLRAGRGGRRRLPGVYTLPPRAELLLSVRRLLGADATRAEVLDGATEVLAACGEDDIGLSDVLARLMRNQAKSEPVPPLHSLAETAIFDHMD